MMHFIFVVFGYLGLRMVTTIVTNIDRTLTWKIITKMITTTLPSIVTTVCSFTTIAHQWSVSHSVDHFV